MPCKVPSTCLAGSHARCGRVRAPLRGFWLGDRRAKPARLLTCILAARTERSGLLVSSNAGMPQALAFGASRQGFSKKNPGEVGMPLGEGVPKPSRGGCQQRASPDRLRCPKYIHLYKYISIIWNDYISICTLPPRASLLPQVVYKQAAHLY